MVGNPKDKFHSKPVLDTFKALTDETRLRILYILTRASFNVNEIKDILGMGQSRISRHLKVLADAGFVTASREGSWVYYSIPHLTQPSDTLPRQLLQCLFAHPDMQNWPKRDVLRVNDILKSRDRFHAAYFNRIGRDWEKIQKEALDPEVYRNAIVSCIPKDREHILDLGCGPGALLSLLCHKAQKITGVDSSDRMIREASELFANQSNVELVQSPLESLPFADSSVDTVVASMVLHHVSNPLQVFMEVHRVLTDSGIFCLVDLDKHSQEYMREKYADLWLGFAVEEMLDWLKETGFQAEQQRSIRMNSEFNVIIIKAINKE